MPPKAQSVTRSVDTLDEAGTALHQLLVRVFGRLPTDRELDTLSAGLAGGMDGREFLRLLTKMPGYRANPQIGTKAPAGHFYSPVVATETVRSYVAMNRKAGLGGLMGIEFPLEAMASFWRAHEAFIASSPFSDVPDGVHRYCYTDGPYRDGDGIMLRTMIHHFRPRRIIEIGSGYSTACMLDTIDELRLADVSLTCVEPQPNRLFSLLRPADRDRITIHQSNVQDIPLDAFRALEANDIVFIDSSHVLKTGSDVHYELFYILPNLAPGVIVHFHDCRFPLEYSDRQIFVKNYSWNEVYAVRALLMYSTRFKVLFHGSLFLHRFPELAAASPAFQRNPGAALWLEVASPPKS